MEVFIEYVKQYPILYNPEARDYRDINKKEGIWKTIVEEMKNPEIKDIKTAKNEWKKLRDGHRESLKRMKSFTSGQAAPLTNLWKYASQLEFLLPYMKKRLRSGIKNETHNNIANTSVEAGNTNESRDTTTTTMGDQNTATLEDSEYVYNSKPLPSTSRDSLLSERKQRKKKANDESLADLLKEIDAHYEKRRREQREKERAEKDLKKHPLKLFFESMSETATKFPDWLQRDVKKKVFNIIMEAEEKYETYTIESQYNYVYSASSTPHSLDPN